MINSIILNLDKKLKKPITTNIGIAVPYYDNTVIIKSDEVFDYPLIVLHEKEVEKLMTAIFKEEYIPEEPQPELKKFLVIKDPYDIAMFMWYIFSYKIDEVVFYIELSFLYEDLNYISVGIDKKTRNFLMDKLYREPISVIRVKNRYLPSIIRGSLEEVKAFIYDDFCIAYHPYESLLMHKGIFNINDLQHVVKGNRISIEDLKSSLKFEGEFDTEKIQDIFTHSKFMLDYSMSNYKKYLSDLKFGNIYFYFRVKKLSKCLFYLSVEDRIEFY